MRCLALAQAWLDLGGTATWRLAAAPDGLVTRIHGEGIEVERVGEPPASPEDGVALAAALGADPTAAGVVDGYHFREPFLEALGGAGSRVLLVDDMAELAAYPVGWILNQNAHADPDAYPASSPARRLLGLRWTMLRREFRVPPEDRPVPDVARRLLVTFGGVDPTGMTLRSIRALAGVDGLEARVVVGAGNRDAEAIHAAAAAHDGGARFDLREAVPDMAAEIRWADLCLTSGGTTVWELARYGTPSLVVETVPAETRLVEGLRSVGLFDTLGSETALDEGTIAGAVTARMADATWRRRMRALGTLLVDGDGARRVALALAGTEEAGA
jgi:spore coat polysaccharide biosynthesis predicted glycosyltransferase SpsG